MKNKKKVKKKLPRVFNGFFIMIALVSSFLLGMFVTKESLYTKQEFSFNYLFCFILGVLAVPILLEWYERFIKRNPDKSGKVD